SFRVSSTVPPNPNPGKSKEDASGDKNGSLAINAFDLAAAFGDPVSEPAQSSDRTRVAAIAANIPLPPSHTGTSTTPSSAITSPQPTGAQAASQSAIHSTAALPEDFDAVFASMGIGGTSATPASSARKAAEPFDFEAAFKDADFSFDSFAPQPAAAAAATSAQSTGTASRRPAPQPPTSQRSVAAASLNNASPALDDTDQTADTVKRSNSVSLEDTHDDFESRFPALPGNSPALLESTPQTTHSKEDLDLAFGSPVSTDDVPLGFEDAFGDHLGKKTSA
ncbi:hypothetical protein THASP1DRAFT_33282, partial [Thamnocephalis sphaerospora]